MVTIRGDVFDNNKNFNIVTLSGARVHTNRYTRLEIREAWARDGQGHSQAVERDPIWCVVVSCDEETAVIYSALFLRRVFNIPTCTHYDGLTLSLYFGDIGGAYHTSMHRWRLIILAYEMLGVDEYGPLFAMEERDD